MQTAKYQLLPQGTTLIILQKGTCVKQIKHQGIIPTSGKANKPKKKKKKKQLWNNILGKKEKKKILQNDSGRLSGLRFRAEEMFLSTGSHIINIFSTPENRGLLFSSFLAPRTYSTASFLCARMGSLSTSLI